MSEPQPADDFNLEEINLCKGCNTMKHLNEQQLCGRCVKGASSDEGAWIDEVLSAVYDAGFKQSRLLLAGKGANTITSDALWTAKAEISRRMAITEADLVWCLGKLRGLGYPAEQLEVKYTLAAQSQEET